MSTPTPDVVAMQEDVSMAYVSLMRGDVETAAQRLCRISTRLETWDEDRRVLKIVADRGLGGLIDSEWNSRLIHKRLREVTASQ